MKTLTLILLFSAITGLVTAQGNAWPKYRTSVERATDQTQKMRKNLSLTESQAKMAYNVNLDIDNQYDAADQNIQESNIAHRKSINKIGSERDTMMEDILTRKQYFRYLKDR